MARHLGHLEHWSAVITKANGWHLGFAPPSHDTSWPKLRSLPRLERCHRHIGCRWARRTSAWQGEISRGICRHTQIILMSHSFSCKASYLRGFLKQNCVGKAQVHAEARQGHLQSHQQVLGSTHVERQVKWTPNGQQGKGLKRQPTQKTLNTLPVGVYLGKVMSQTKKPSQNDEPATPQQ